MKVFFSMLFFIVWGHVSAFENTQVIRLSDSVSLTAEMQAFVKDKHELFFCNPQKLCLIDGYPVFGTEGTVPQIELKSLILLVNQKAIPLEHRGMYNPWSPIEGKSLDVQIVEDSANGLRIRGEFSDGSATYIVEWLVLGTGSARVLIDCLECVSATYSRTLEKN